MKQLKNQLARWLGLLMATLLITGCAPQSEQIERHVQTMMIEVIKPAVVEAIAKLDPQAGVLQGTAMAIAPGYSATFEGMWVVGIKGEFTIRAEGVAGNLSGTLQSTGPGDATTGGL